MASIVEDFSPDGSTLVEMTAFHLGTGGKRLRALLPLAVATAHEEDLERFLPFACACELLHNATLVHDDLQDGDEIRRGEPTIWVKFGKPQAINLGDALLYYAIAAVSNLEFPSEKKQTVIRRFVRNSLYVIDGQEREFGLQTDESAKIDDYFRMVEGKTSGLFALPFAGAAELCGSDEETITDVEKASRDLGVAFQIQDDVLDIFGDKGRERRGSDIAEGKRSALAMHALWNADEKDWLRELLNTDRDQVSDDDIAKATAIFRDAGSLEFALDEIDRRCESARQRLAQRDAHLAVANALIDAFMEPIKTVRR